MKHLTKILDYLDDLSIRYFLWLYENIEHLFGVLGLILTLASIYTIFIGNFAYTFLILSVALMSLWLDLLIKEDD